MRKTNMVEWMNEWGIYAFIHLNMVHFDFILTANEKFNNHLRTQPDNDLVTVI